MVENKQEAKALDISKKNKLKQKSKYLLIGGLVVLVIVAFLLGLLLNQGNGDKQRITGVQPKINEATVTGKIKEPSKSPQEVINGYYDALKNQNYEEAAKYVSNHAKKIDKMLADNPADRLHQQNIKEPVVDYVFNEIKDIYDQTHKEAWVDVKRQGYSSSNSERKLLEFEEGQWKVNPTGLIDQVVVDKALLKNADVEINSIEIEVSPDKGVKAAINAKVSDQYLFQFPTKEEDGKKLNTEITLTTDQGTFTLHYFPLSYDSISNGQSGIIYADFPEAKGKPKSLKMANFYYLWDGKTVKSNHDQVEVPLS